MELFTEMAQSRAYREEKVSAGQERLTTLCERTASLGVDDFVMAPLCMH